MFLSSVIRSLVKLLVLAKRGRYLWIDTFHVASKIDRRVFFPVFVYSVNFMCGWTEECRRVRRSALGKLDGCWWHLLYFFANRQLH